MNLQHAGLKLNFKNVPEFLIICKYKVFLTYELYNAHFSAYSSIICCSVQWLLELYQASTVVNFVIIIIIIIVVVSVIVIIIWDYKLFHPAQTPCLPHILPTPSCAACV
jgi:hypothetical protein